MPTDEDKSTVGERNPAGLDPKDVDGLLTVEQDSPAPSSTSYGHDETDTLDVEETAEPVEEVHPPSQNGITAADTV